MSIAADNHAELFPWVLVVMSAISLECFLIPFVYTVRVRSATFTKEFMQQFESEHKAAFPEDQSAPPIGFPDMGNGYFSKKLTYEQWFKFNNAQRVHYNFLESLPMVLILLFITALKQPLAALILGCIYFVARLVYSLGYGIGGPNMRAIGAMPINLTHLALLGFSFYTSAEFLKLYNP